LLVNFSSHTWHSRTVHRLYHTVINA
jgi:hypothetical protein